MVSLYRHIVCYLYSYQHLRSYVTTNGVSPMYLLHVVRGDVIVSVLQHSY